MMTCLDAHSEKTEDLYLVFWYQLGECNQYAGEECHLAVILHSISDETQRVINQVVMVSYKNKSAFLVARNSIQLKANAMIFGTVTQTMINLNVSTVPHNLSK